MVLVKRHIAKALTYRIIGSVVTIVVTYNAGLNIKWASLVGVSELLIKPFLYFIHERVWYKWVKFGLKEDSK
jgi:uncharacterized membrane protein